MHEAKLPVCCCRKTLQVLAFVWTALKQGPWGRPMAAKVVIVSPSSLCKNWAEEARKWLGVERLKVLSRSTAFRTHRDATHLGCCHCWKLRLLSKGTLCHRTQVMVIAAGAEAKQQVQVTDRLLMYVHEVLTFAVMLIALSWPHL